MTFQGARARPAEDGSARVYEVSKIRQGADGRVLEVLWGEVDPRADGVVTPRVVVPVADVVDALHDGARVAAVFSRDRAQVAERDFVVVEHADGQEGIAFDATRSRGRELRDMVRLED